MTKHRDSLARQKISVNIRTVKQQILCRIQPHIISETAEIVVDFFCSCILIRHHKFPWYLRCHLLHQMYFLGIHASADLNGTFSPLDLSIQLFELRQFRQRTCKYLTHLLFTSTCRIKIIFQSIFKITYIDIFYTLLFIVIVFFHTHIFFHNAPPAR